MNKIFVDTSGIVAAINYKDQYHQRAKEILVKIADQKPTLVITNYIRIETHSLLNNKVNQDTALRFLDDPGWLIEWVSPGDEQKAIQLLHRYYDKSFSLTDATSFIIMERLGLRSVMTFDKHFSQYGFNPIT
jgi:predicted nucleic acid-binding protein